MYYMVKVIITEKLHTLCEGHKACHCPTITGDKACALVMLANTFVSETNPVSFEMSNIDFIEFRLYVALASLRERG